MLGMVAATLLTSIIVSSLGVIGFVGLISPHMVRRALGDDHRFLLPGSCVLGALLLLAGDIGARLALAPRLLPVSVVTTLIGAPTFLYLLVRGGRR
jgi:iron complex transport system permease protein